MRISDWSSDVCSSDLKILEQISIPIQVAGGLRDESTITEVSKICNRVVLGTLAFNNKPVLQKLLSNLGDRKSVMKGMSVEVREDIVDHRIIKKKRRRYITNSISNNKIN